MSAPVLPGAPGSELRARARRVDAALRARVTVCGSWERAPEPLLDPLVRAYALLGRIEAAGVDRA